MAARKSLIRVLSLSLLFVLISCDFPYKTGYFDTYIDHFNHFSNGEKTYKMRYLYQDMHWNPHGGPIFFYAGNEGPIEAFWTATGFMHEIAGEFGAYVVFPEHRYYGKSLPFGDQSFQHPNLGYLTVEQAMADYAYFLTDLRTRIKAKKQTKIVAFGGSYGGMLAAYMRFKYPNIVDGGALAASAPIFMQAVDGPHDFFFSHVTRDFQAQGDKCVERVKSAFRQMNDYVARGQSGLDEISSKFHLCKKLTSQSDYRHLLGWARNAFVMMAMLDYPYPTGFMASLPGNPVKVACEKITAAPDDISGLVAASGIFYNASSKPCFDIFKEFYECADPTGCGTGPAAVAWNFQACTELRLPAGSNNVTDMFPVLPWTSDMRRDYCQKTFGVIPRESWPGIQFWGENIGSSSNIIFSNGDLDPWMDGGVKGALPKSMPKVKVEGGAHHLDLRAANKLDPPGVIEARERERKFIRSWLI